MQSRSDDDQALPQTNVSLSLSSYRQVNIERIKFQIGYIIHFKSRASGQLISRESPQRLREFIGKRNDSKESSYCRSVM